MKKISLFLAASLFFLTACTEFKEVQVAELTDSQRVENNDKLTPEENTLLKGYLNRKADSNVTVEKAIELQKIWEDEQVQIAAFEKEKAEKEMQEKIAAQKIEQEKINTINKMMSIKVTQKETETMNVRRKPTLFNVFFYQATNNSNKTIVDYQTQVTVSDQQGKVLTKALFSKQDTLNPGETSIDNVAIETNDISIEDRFLIKTDINSLVFNFDLKTIIFSDGTKIQIL